MSDWVTVCTVEDIPLLGSRRVQRKQGVDVALFRTDGDVVHALLDRCPHKGGPLSQGIVAGTHVACPLHNWRIGLADGQAAEPDEGCTPAFSVRVHDGAVQLKRSELDTLATDLTRPVAGPARGASDCAA
ncbi:MAG: nitrite reductase small subunit NirD [Rhodoferax sp.]|nr:nitrite reductase small subunit NirD [Rhodoferax sp.]